MIRLEAGMPTARFCRLIGVPERSYRRWQQRAAARAAGEGAVADAVGRPDRAGRARLRRPLSAVGLEDDRDADAGRRPPRARRDRLPRLEAQRPGARGQLPGRAAPARRGAPGGVRGAALGPESGLAARLHRVRDPDGRHLADRRHRRLLVEARARLPRRDRPRTTATRSRPSSSRSPRPSGCSAARCSTLVTDPTTGEIRPVALVTDNGPCFKSAASPRSSTSIPS